MADEVRGARRVLDLGCGEGQVARHVARAAAVPEVVGADPSPAQLGVARERGGAPRYVRAAARALPFASGVFDAVLVCLVFEHLLDVEAPVREIARVLTPGGSLLLLLNHPLLQAPGSGWIDDQILGEQYWRVGPYLGEQVADEELEPGVVLPFVHRPLSRYVNTMTAAGLLVEQMDEPAPPAGCLARAPEYADAASIPRLLVLRARRVSAPPAGAGGRGGAAR